MSNRDLEKSDLNSSNNSDRINSINNTITPPVNKIQQSTSAPTELDIDLKKAITFLLSREMKDYSIEKKKEFLLSKLPSETVEKALSILPVIESNIFSKIKEYQEKKDSDNNSFFSFLPSMGILSSILLSTLGVNYLLDLNRNKKNDLFYKECEKKLNDELQKISKDLKNQISNELNEYVTKETLKDKISNEIVEYNQKRGLNLNLSSKSVKDEVVKIKEDLLSKEKIIKDLEVKIENNKVLLKSEILKETNQILEDNNNRLLIKILENQDKLLNMITSEIGKNSGEQGNQSIVNSQKNHSGNINDVKNKETFSNSTNFNLNKCNTENPKNIYNQSPEILLTESINLKNDIDNNNVNSLSQDEKDQRQNEISLIKNTLGGNDLPVAVVFNENEQNIPALLFTCLCSIKDDKDKVPFVKQLKNQFSAILETMKKDSSMEALPFINTTNRVYKNVDNNLLSKLLKLAGFRNENSGSIYKYKGDYEKLKQTLDTFDEYDK
jgi:hypothetical protein